MTHQNQESKLKEVKKCGKQSLFFTIPAMYGVKIVVQ
jgi:hypothetical protein